MHVLNEKMIDLLFCVIRSTVSFKCKQNNTARQTICAHIKKLGPRNTHFLLYKRWYFFFAEYTYALKYSHLAIFTFLIGNVCSELWRLYASLHSATTCREIFRNDKTIRSICHTLYMVGASHRPRYHRGLSSKVLS